MLVCYGAYIECEIRDCDIIDITVGSYNRILDRTTDIQSTLYICVDLRLHRITISKDVLTDWIFMMIRLWLASYNGHCCIYLTLTDKYWMSIPYAVSRCVMYLVVYLFNLHKFMIYIYFLHDRPWISPWIKSISKGLDITCHVFASQLSGHCDAIANRLWRHQQSVKRASGTRGWCVKILVFSIIYGFVMSCKK